LGHEVIVAHARNVRLIGESSRKDDRLDAQHNKCARFWPPD
jgi:transposase